MKKFWEELHQTVMIATMYGYNQMEMTAPSWTGHHLLTRPRGEGWLKGVEIIAKTIQKANIGYSLDSAYAIQPDGNTRAFALTNQIIAECRKAKMALPHEEWNNGDFYGARGGVDCVLNYLESVLHNACLHEWLDLGWHMERDTGYRSHDFRCAHCNYRMGFETDFKPHQVMIQIGGKGTEHNLHPVEAQALYDRLVIEHFADYFWEEEHWKDNGTEWHRCRIYGGDGEIAVTVTLRETWEEIE